MTGWRIYLHGLCVVSGLDCYRALTIAGAMRADGHAPVVVSPGGVPWR
jgi:hypothetical protein